MIPIYRKYARTLLDIGVLLVTLYAVLKLLQYVYGILEPLFWCLLVFACIEPLALYLTRKGIPKAVASAIAVFILLLALLLIIGVIGYFFLVQVIRFSSSIPHYSASLSTQLNLDIHRLQTYLQARGIHVQMTGLSQWTTTIANQGSHWLSILFNSLVGLVSSFSHTFYSVALGVILAYFLSLESERWADVMRKSPGPLRATVLFLQQHVLPDIVRYLRTLLVLIVVTFPLCVVPLLILHVPNPVFGALLISVSSVVPILAIGTTFIPWIIYLLATGQFTLAIWMTVLYLALGLFQQVFTPKLFGDSLGVSAFAMLLLLILFGSLFGFLGIILSPILTILVSRLFREGYVKEWIYLPD